MSVLWNMCFCLLVIDCMVFTAHGIHRGELGDRLGINLTLLLTAMAFKWVLSDALPSTPYLTDMEKYVIMTFAMLFLQGMCFWFVSGVASVLCPELFPVSLPVVFLVCFRLCFLGCVRVVSRMIFDGVSVCFRGCFRFCFRLVSGAVFDGLEDSAPEARCNRN